MSLEQYRQEIVAAVEAAKATFTSYPVVIEYDNRPIINWETQVDPCLCVHIVWMRGEQADLSNSPVHRTQGVITLAAMVKNGAGTAKSLLLLTHFFRALQFKTLGSVRTLMSSYASAETPPGWHSTGAVVPFWADEFT